jgi:hypothetical protein
VPVTLSLFHTACATHARPKPQAKAPSPTINQSINFAPRVRRSPFPSPTRCNLPHPQLPRETLLRQHYLSRLATRICSIATFRRSRRRLRAARLLFPRIFNTRAQQGQCVVDPRVRAIFMFVDFPCRSLRCVPILLLTRASQKWHPSTRRRTVPPSPSPSWCLVS